jgi:hypothetical protein
MSSLILWKDKPQTGRKYSEYIYKTMFLCLQLNNKKIKYSFKRGVKDEKIHKNEYYQLANKHTKDNQHYWLSGK